MKLTRFAALVAVPTALSLAACGGGSSGVLGNNIGTGGQTANIRLVNGTPDLGVGADFYYQATGAPAPGTTANGQSTTNVPYGQTTPFFSEPTTAATVAVRPTGASPSSSAAIACPVPQLQTNAKYTIVLAGTAANRTCRLFQDFDYNSTSPQYRVHDAAASLGSSVAYGATNPGTPATNNSANVAQLGGNAINPSGATFTPVQPAGPIPNPTTDVNFVIGSSAAASGTPIAPIDTLDAKNLFASGSLAQPNSSGTLNYTGTAGTSLFVIDCTAAAVASLPGVQCNQGAALIGTFDTL